MTVRRSTSSAFTMIELIVVLVIMAIAMAMVAPSLRGWGDNAKLRDATDQFMAAAVWTRAEAILTATPHILEIDPTTNQYVVSAVDVDGTTTSPVAKEFGRPTELPPMFAISLVSGGEGGKVIRFFPDSRTTPAVVRITSAQGVSNEIGCTAPAEPFRVLGAAK